MTTKYQILERPKVQSHLQVALPRPYLPRLVRIPPIDQLYSINSIRKLKNPQNGRSIQSITFWVGVTNKSDMRMDSSRPHRPWTQTQAHPKQTVSEDSYQCYDSTKKHKGIKVTLWLRKTRYKKAWGAPALTTYTTVLKQKDWHRFHEVVILVY